MDTKPIVDVKNLTYQPNAMRAAERGKWEDFDLEYTSRGNVCEIPQEGRSLIVIAQVNKILHFRVFESDGNRAADTDETKMTKNSQLASLKSRLKHGQTLAGDEKRLIITAVTELVGATWRWKQIYGGGRRMIKQKHASFDHCRWLHQAGANLKAGRTQLAAGA